MYWYNGTTEKWYINGRQSGSHDTPNAEWNAAFKIGQYDLVNYPYKGLIDEVRVHNAVLTISQIQSQYRAGLNRLLAKGLINGQEYRERLIVN
jgi:hypothetical protein